MRKALSLAFDEDWVSKNLFHGEFKRIDSYYPNSVLSSATQIKKEKTSFRLNLRAAADLLNKSGWIIENGKRIHKDTKEPLSFELLLSTPQDEKIAITYQRSLERLGIDMKIRMMDSATFQKRKNEYDYDMIAFYWQNSLSPGTEQSLYWSCKAANEPARFNYSGICKKELDKAARQIANSKTYDELTNYAQIIDRILLSEYISI